jgi:hypothetical protein
MLPIRSVRRAYARAAVLVALTLTAAACAKSLPLAPTGTGPWRFSGTVATFAGAPIAGAQLTVVDGVNLGEQIRTDAAGRFAFASLEGGRFTMTIAAPGFVSVTPLVDLAADLEVNFALRDAQ